MLQLDVGSAYAVRTGWVGLEVERAYIRARELCERLGDPPEGFPALQGLWAVHAMREELGQAFPIAEQLLRVAQVTGDRPGDSRVVVHGEDHRPRGGSAIGGAPAWGGLDHSVAH